MSKCKTCGAPVRYMPPDGDLRYDPPAIRSPSPEPIPAQGEAAAWQANTVQQLQRAIMDEDEDVRERATVDVAQLYAISVAPYAAALAMVREAIGELFGPASSIESEDATLLRGPEPHHEAEAQIAALQRISALYLRPSPALTISEEMADCPARDEFACGMAVAAGIIMHGWGADVFAEEILSNAGLTTVGAMRKAGVDTYDIRRCVPVLRQFRDRADLSTLRGERQ